MKTTLLIVDDSPIIVKSLMEIFSEMSGLDIVGTADDVDSAIESIAELKPDIVILDYQLKKGTGIEVLRYIRKNKYNTIVFIFTNYGYSEYRKHCMEEGADFFIKKIGETNTLIKEVESLIVNKREEIKNEMEKFKTGY